jgi:hypothetical protein
MAAGCTAFSVQGTHPSKFGEGGRNTGQQAAYWGNPPICFGVPGESEPPMLVDAATGILADYQRGPVRCPAEHDPGSLLQVHGIHGHCQGPGRLFCRSKQRDRS